MKTECWWCGEVKSGCKIVKIGLLKSIVKKPLCRKCFKSLKGNTPKANIFGILFKHAEYLSKA